jgi:hypothetical protein
VLIQQNSAFETQLADLAERNNLLRNRMFTENASKGLVYLGHEGWVSEREIQFLNSRLSAQR